MNAKAVAKDFSGYLKREGIPNKYVKEHDLDTIRITWAETENCPDFDTKILFEKDMGVVFIAEDFKYFSLESEEYVTQILIMVNDLTGDDIILSWYCNSYEDQNMQVFVRYALVGDKSRSNAEYYEILNYLVEAVQEKFSMLP